MARLSASGPHRSSLWRRLRPRENAATLLRGARVAALVLAAAALALGVAENAAAQTTLVSNAGQGDDTAWTSVTDRAQAFTTSAGATLSSVEIISEDQQGDDVAVSLCTVDGSNYPTSSCTALTAPSSFAAGTLVFRAPANTTLAANTTYSLVVATPGDEALSLDVTSSDDEDDGGATGWSIANTFYIQTAPTTWVANGRSLRITIKGTITASSNNAPTVATAIPDQAATAGTAFSYAFPANTFADTDAGDTLTYTATKSDDSALPSWLSFTAATRTFSGTPMAADVGTVSVKVTASDGTDSVSDTFDIVVSAAADTTPPEVESVTVASSGSDVYLVFDEDLDVTAGEALLASVFSLTVAGQALTIADHSIQGTDLVLTVQTGTIKQGQTVVVSYTDPTAADDTVALQDSAGNDVASFTTGMSGVPAVTNDSTVTPNTAATGAPTITGTAQVGETLTASTTGIADANGLTSPTYTYQWIRANGTEADIASANSSTYILVAADLGKTIKVEVGFRDADGYLEMLTSAATAVVAADMTRPMLSSATVQGRVLTLVYDEPLDEGSEPAVSAFTLAGTTATVTMVSVMGRRVILTLTEPAETDVTLTYMPGTNPVQDEAGNDAPRLIDESVMRGNPPPPRPLRRGTPRRWWRTLWRTRRSWLTCRSPTWSLRTHSRTRTGTR